MGSADQHAERRALGEPAVTSPGARKPRSSRGALPHVLQILRACTQTLRVTPATEAGVSDQVWSLQEIVGLLDAVESRGA
jgi:hypothetical protein